MHQFEILGLPLVHINIDTSRSYVDSPMSVSTRIIAHRMAAPPSAVPGVSKCQHLRYCDVINLIATTYNDVISRRKMYHGERDGDSWLVFVATTDSLGGHLK